MANSRGRPRIDEGEKSKTLTLSFKQFYIDHIKRNGGSKYIVKLIDKDIADRKSITSSLVEKLRKMSDPS